MAGDVGIARRSARRNLEKWIDVELQTYVRDMINDGDYVELRKHLLDIAEAHATHAAQRARKKRHV